MPSASTAPTAHIAWVMAAGEGSQGKRRVGARGQQQHHPAQGSRRYGGLLFVPSRSSWRWLLAHLLLCHKIEPRARVWWWCGVFDFGVGGCGDLGHFRKLHNKLVGTIFADLSAGSIWLSFCRLNGVELPGRLDWGDLLVSVGLAPSPRRNW